MKWFLILLLAANAFAEGVRVKQEKGDETYSRTAWGSGVFIEKNKVLTCWHVVDDEGQVFVEVGGNWLKCEVIKHDEEADLALLKCSGESKTVTKLAKSEGLTLSVSDEAKPIEVKNVTSHSARVIGDVKDGNSGGPVLNKSGELVGIIYARSKDDSFGFYVTIDQIRSFLGKN